MKFLGWLKQNSSYSQLGRDSTAGATTRQQHTLPMIDKWRCVSASVHLTSLLPHSWLYG